MEIILGKTAGFCYGVERAVAETKKELSTRKNIYCLGELVHNKTVIEDLEKNGVKFIDNINAAEGTIIIRAHGAPKETYELIKKKGLEIKDLTCPNVLRTHNIAIDYSEKNYFIILIGIKSHPESIGTLSFCGKNSYLLQEKEEIPELIEKIENSKINNILIFAQTTYNSKKFDNIVEELKQNLKNKNVVVHKTICGATEVRQKETIEISKKVEVMIIIGDKKSSNTNKLYDISKEKCKKVFLVQNASELDLKELEKVTKVGIMAGASTPREDIEEIIGKIRGNEK